MQVLLLRRRVLRRELHGGLHLPLLVPLEVVDLELREVRALRFEEEVVGLGPNL